MRRPFAKLARLRSMASHTRTIDYGEAVTDHGPNAGQIVHKQVIEPVSLETADRARVVAELRGMALAIRLFGLSRLPGMIGCGEVVIGAGRK